MSNNDHIAEAQAVLTGEDLHARLYARYRETLAETRRLDDLPGPWTGEAKRAHDAYWQAFKALVETPPETPAGLLIVANALAEDIVAAGGGSWKDRVDLTAARNVRDGIARLVASGPDPDDEIVAAWDAWRAEWLRHKEAADDEADDARAENRIAALERKIIAAPAHGLRGIAAKAGQAIWYAFSKQDMTGRGGFLSPPEDQDWDVRCAISLALALERLTGIPVHPRWDLEAKPTS